LEALLPDAGHGITQLVQEEIMSYIVVITFDDETEAVKARQSLREAQICALHAAVITTSLSEEQHANLKKLLEGNAQEDV